MNLESIIRIDSSGKLAIKVSEKLYSDISEEFEKDFRQYIIHKYNFNSNLCGNGIKIDLTEEINIFCKVSGYNIDILEKQSNGEYQIEIRELTDLYIDDDDDFDLDDVY